jgi:hypothetical protein
MKRNFSVFTDEALTVKVDSVKEIMYEGNELKHCVFTNKYHGKIHYYYQRQ